MWVAFDNVLYKDLFLDETTVNYFPKFLMYQNCNFWKK